MQYHKLLYLHHRYSSNKMIISENLKAHFRTSVIVTCKIIKGIQKEISKSFMNSSFRTYNLKSIKFRYQFLTILILNLYKLGKYETSKSRER